MRRAGLPHPPKFTAADWRRRVADMPGVDSKRCRAGERPAPPLSSPLLSALLPLLLEENAAEIS